eukprot:g9177.t2
MQDECLAPMTENVIDGTAMDAGYAETTTAVSSCSCHEGPSAENMVCMSPQVFAFCVVLSALASGIVVASQRIHSFARERLRNLLEPSRVHKPRLGHRSASRLLDREAEGPLIVEAAEAMDRAAAAPLEQKVPPRYVRAFCGNETHALERWKATRKWRKENEIDSILNEPQPYFHDIRRYFPSHISGRSRGGHMVVYEKLGDVDMRTLRRHVGVSVPMLLRHWIFVSEYMYRVLQPTDSAQQINVEDMKGVRMQTLAGKIQEYIKAVAQLARLYYVERCHKTFVVNAPAWFGLSFRVVSPFLSARTRQKIRILGSDLAALQDEIDPQFLPVEYGGTMIVPVSESPDERNLRRLVDAINANAETANTSISSAANGTNGGAKSSASNGGNSSSSRSSRTPSNSKSPPKKGSRKREGSAAVREAQRSLPGKDQQQQQLHFSPRSGRTRARTNDDAAQSRVRNDLSPIPTHADLTRRATWTGGGGHEKERRLPSSKGKEGGEGPAGRIHLNGHLKRVATNATGNPAATEMRGLRGQPSDEEEDVKDRGGPGVPWRATERRKEGEEREPAGVGVGVRGRRGAATQGRPARRQDKARREESFDARPGHGELEEDSLPIEDRLQAVMKDLGVPSGEQS